MGKFTMSLDPTQAATGVARFSKCCSSQAATLEGHYGYVVSLGIKTQESPLIAL